MYTDIISKSFLKALFDISKNIGLKVCTFYESSHSNSRGWIEFIFIIGMNHN